MYLKYTNFRVGVFCVFFFKDWGTFMKKMLQVLLILRSGEKPRFPRAAPFRKERQVLSDRGGLLTSWFRFVRGGQIAHERPPKVTVAVCFLKLKFGGPWLTLLWTSLPK